MPMSLKLPSVVWVAGCGFIGRAVAELLEKGGCEVVGLTHSEESAVALRGEVGFPVRACDISDESSLQALVEDDSLPVPEAIVHCASSGRGGVEKYEAVYYWGCVHFRTVFPEATLLFTSSSSVYPQVEGEKVTEDSEAEPDRATGQVLRRAEDVVLEGQGIVARLAGLYGPGRSVLLKRFLDGTAVIETGPSRFLNTVHRDDVASALVVLLGQREVARGEIYNVSDGAPTTQRACYEGMAAHFDRPVPPEGEPDHGRKRGWTHKQVSVDKLMALGWVPRYAGFLDAVRTDPSLVESLARHRE